MLPTRSPIGPSSLLGVWTVDEWSARNTLNGLGIVDECIGRDDSGRVVYSGYHPARVRHEIGQLDDALYIDQAGGETMGWAELSGSEVGEAMHVEQRRQLPNGRRAILGIRYYDIQPNHFSWAVDGSTRDFLRIEATRQRTLRP